MCSKFAKAFNKKKMQKYSLLFIGVFFVIPFTSAWAGCNAQGDIMGINGAILVPGGCGGAPNNTNVTVFDGATITSASSGIKATTSSGPGGHPFWDIVNNGSIQGNHDGIEIDDGAANGDPSKVTNKGTIQGGDAGVILGRGGTVTNALGASISANNVSGVGVALTLSGSVMNSGTITSSNTNGTGVGLGAGGTVTNTATGVISGQIRGISIDGGEGNITNDGTITSGGRAIQFGFGGVGFGSVTNNKTGVISSTGTRVVIGFAAAGAGTVLNYGRIDGSGLQPVAGVLGTIFMSNLTTNGIVDNEGGTIIGILGSIPAINIQSANSKVINNNGTITGDVDFALSGDHFTMAGNASHMTGKLQMGTGGNETATFQNTTDTNTNGISIINGGGKGFDQLIFDGATFTGVGRIVNWETVTLKNGATLNLDTTLTLGGTSADTTATLNIQNATLNANYTPNSIIQANTARPVLVNNAGLITIASQSANNSLIIRGNYVGAGGILELNSVLNADNSPADKLVIDGISGGFAARLTGSSASGSTGILVHNIGGAGALTTSNGILVVEAINNATTTANAFTLAAPVRAGAYDYRLFRGGLDPNDPVTSQDWFLRSRFAPLNPILGPELSVYGSVLPSALDLTRVSLGTLEDRVGDEATLLCTTNPCGRRFVNGGWARVFTQPYKAQFSSIVNPTARGNIRGIQGGLDLYRDFSPSSGLNIFGLYYTHAMTNPDIDGLVTNADATANINQRTGSLNLEAETGGGYLTHFWCSGAYFDLVGQFTSYHGDAHSTRTSISLRGEGGSGSAEVGYPFRLARQLVLEPEGQLIYEYAKFDHKVDDFSDVGFGSSHAFLGRAGAQLKYIPQTCNLAVQPFVRANLWSTLSGNSNSTVYGPNLNGENSISTSAKSTWVQLGGGFNVKAIKKVTIYAFGDGLIATNQSHRKYDGFDAGAGLRVNM